MSDEKINFLSNQSIKDSSGIDLNFINKIIFYTGNFEFLSTRLFLNGVWEKQLFEYDYREEELIANLNITNPDITAIVHPSITVPTVLIEENQYTMYTYYIAKCDKLDFSKTNYCWFSCDEIIAMVKEKSYTSATINNLRRFFELLFDHKNKV